MTLPLTYSGYYLQNKKSWIYCPEIRRILSVVGKILTLPQYWFKQDGPLQREHLNLLLREILGLYPPFQIAYDFQEVGAYHNGGNFVLITLLNPYQ